MPLVTMVLPFKLPCAGAGLLGYAGCDDRETEEVNCSDSAASLLDRGVVGAGVAGSEGSGAPISAH